VDLYEYQAKELFATHGVTTQVGKVVSTPEDAQKAAAEFNCAVVVKAQVKTGGRGKAGGVKLANNPSEALEKAKNILGLDIKGHIVKKILITPAEDIKEEYYVSFLLDRTNRTFLSMASVAGGMDIEEVAAKTPEKLAMTKIDPLTGVDSAKALEISIAAGIPSEVQKDVAVLIEKMWKLFVASDATLVEVNPLVRTNDDRIVALDGKVTLDENANFRHPENENFVDTANVDPLETAAKAKDLNYVKLDGSVGIIGNGSNAKIVGVMEVIFTDQAETAAYTTLNKKEYLERVAYQLLVNSEPLAMEAQELALAVYHIFGCRDAARVDLRCDAHGLLQFLEINPLPGLDHIYSDLPIMGRLAGVKYTEIINAIVNAAWQRYQCG